MTDGSSGKTRFAVLSSPARSAIATIWVSGGEAGGAIGRCFNSRSGIDASGFTVGAIHFGYWIRLERAVSAESADTGAAEGEGVVVCRVGDLEYEIHCHGGVAAQAAIAADLAGMGFRQMDWAAFGCEFAANTIQAEAVAALRQAQTDRTAAILLEQYNGALLDAIDKCISLIKQFKMAQAALLVDDLLTKSAAGLHLVDPYRIVIAGRPNVGKSSLINRLLGFERAIVFDQPGTTRDVTRSTTAFDGWPVALSDTAGLRLSNDEIEAEGVDRATSEMNAADVIVLVFDASDFDWTAEDRQLLATCSNGLVVFNKTDLPKARSKVKAALREISSDRTCLSVSAVTGEALPELMQAISDAMVACVPQSGDAVPFTRRQNSLLRSARESIEKNESARAITELKSLAGRPGTS